MGVVGVAEVSSVPSSISIPTVVVGAPALASAIVVVVVPISSPCLRLLMMVCWWHVDFCWGEEVLLASCHMPYGVNSTPFVVGVVGFPFLELRGDFIIWLLFFPPLLLVPHIVL